MDIDAPDTRNGASHGEDMLPEVCFKLTQDGTVRFGTGVFFDFYVMRCRVVL